MCLMSILMIGPGNQYFFKIYTLLYIKNNFSLSPIMVSHKLQSLILSKFMKSVKKNKYYMCISGFVKSEMPMCFQVFSICKYVELKIILKFLY
jgi:hypothetical protein